MPSPTTTAAAKRDAAGNPARTWKPSEQPGLSDPTDRVLDVDDATDEQDRPSPVLDINALPLSMRMSTTAEQLGAKPPVISPETVLSDEQRTSTKQADAKDDKKSS